MTQLHGPIQLEGNVIASRPATGHDRQPFFSRDEAKLYIWDATIGPSGSWVAITSDAVSVDFELNGNPLNVQNKINFIDDGLLQIIEESNGDLRWDSSGAINAAQDYSDSQLASEAATRSSADGVLASGLSTETSARISADLVLTAAVAAIVVPATKAPTSHKWLASYSASTGLFTQTQPDYSDLTGTPTLATVATSGAYADLTGKPTLPATKAAASTKFLTAYDSSTGLFTNGQPDFTDLSGTATAAQIPNLAASKITSGALALARGGTGVDLSASGGTTKILAQDASQVISARDLVAADIPNLAASKITSGTLALARGGTNADLSGTGGTSQVLKQTSVGGAVTVAQLAFTDISGAAVASQIPSLDAGKITTGALALARGGTGVDLSASGGTTKILAQDASQVISARDLVAADIPSLAASKITSGQLALARGGTNADLSGTGGTSQVLKQTSVGGAVTVAQLAFSDLSGSIAAGQIASGTVLWNTLGNAGGALTLANAGNATTFNHTSGVTWTWANTTVATLSANNNSPILKFASDIWTNGADTAAGFTLQSTITAAPNNKTITNSVENGSNQVTLTVGSSHGFVALQRVTFTGLTTATWLNGVTVIILSVAATTITFIDPTSHGTSASHADTGTATQVPTQELTLASFGTNGDARLILPISGFANGNVGCGGFAFAGQGALVGYGPLSAAQGGFAIYSVGGSSSLSQLALYRTSPGPAAASYTQVIAAWEYGDNSGGNSTSSIATQQLNFSMGIVGSMTSGTSNPNTFVGGNGGNAGNFANTAGTAIGFGMGFGKGVTNAFTWSPASGSGNYVAAQINSTLNQTGSASGVYTALKISMTETALANAAGNLLLDFYAGSGGATRVYSLGNGGTETTYTPNGAQWTCDSATELLTLSTSGLTTDTASNLLPANSIIEAVVCRITTAITTATDWAVGDPTTSNRFSSANATKTLGTVSTGLNHWSGASGTLANGPSQPSAAKVRITCTGSNPGAGAIRITVFYRTFIAPTS